MTETKQSSIIDSYDNNNVINNAINKMDHTLSKFQEHLYAYISTFDGTKKDFWNADIQTKFITIVHPSYAGMDAMRLLHAHFFALGSKAVSFNCHRMSADVFFVKFRLVNDKTDVTVEQLIHVRGGRIIHTSPRVEDVNIIQVGCSDDGDDESMNVKHRSQVRWMRDCPRPKHHGVGVPKPNVLGHRHKSEGERMRNQIHHLRV